MGGRQAVHPFMSNGANTTSASRSPTTGMRYLVALHIALMLLLLRSAVALQSFTMTDIECEPEYTLLCTVKSTHDWKTDAQFGIAFNYIDEKRFYYLKLSRAGVAVFKVTPSGEKRIDTPIQLYRPTTPQVKIAVKRRQKRIVVVCDDKVVTRASDGEYVSGRIAYSSVPNGAFQIERLRLQPIEEIYYGDDFTRASQEVGVFEFVGGEWKLTGLGEPTGNPDYKANAFALRASSKQPSFAVFGYWFWDNYKVSVAVKPTLASAVGLCAFYQDERNYILMRWTNALSGDGGKCELLQCVDGKVSVLASKPIGFVPGVWYSLSLCATDEALIGSIDGVPVLNAQTHYFSQGKVALYVDGCNEAYFDDIEVATWEHFYDSFMGYSLSDWEVWSGAWSVKGGVLSGQGESAYLATGLEDWSDYDALVSVANIKGSAGIAFLCQGKGRHYLLRCAPKGNEALITLSIVEDGALHVLSTSKFERWGNAPHKLKVAVKSCGILEGFVDDVLVVRAYNTALRKGYIALYCNGSATFDDVLVQFRERRYKEPSVARQFLKEEYMIPWATSRGMWDVTRSDGAFTYWCYGRFYGEDGGFGETEIEFDWLRAIQYCSELTFSFGASERNFSSGALLKLSRLDRPNKIRLTIQEGDKVLAQTEWQKEEEKLPVRISASSGYIAVVIDGEPVIGALLENKLRGNELAIRVGERPIDITLFKLYPSNLFDTTFWKAPVEFYQTRGNWDIVPRWPCELDWSWYGGLGDRVPVVWTKMRFSGDMVIEFYGNIGMDLPKEPGYSRPSDINISFCADGLNLNSGYSFIYSGWDNSKSALLKGDKILAESTQHHFIYPHNHNFSFHQRWFYIRIEKTGERIRCYVHSPETKQEDLVCDVVDKDALNSGYVALWSYHNILLVARLRIWYQRCEPSLEHIKVLKPIAVAREQKMKMLQTATAHQEPNNDFEAGIGSWVPLGESNEVILTRDASTKAGGKYSLRVTNAINGGHFGVRAFAGHIDLKSRPKLRFAYRLQNGVKVNIYFRSGEWWYALVLTGSDEPPIDLRMKVIGKVQDAKADGNWHWVELNLLKAFMNVEPNATSYTIDEIVIGELNDPPYLQAGFGGNTAGMSYWIDEFTLR
ncbi:MAG: hypothetical protein HZRFUVUK_000892 [Candidatus Fervidibacterota bacterium]